MNKYVKLVEDTSKEQLEEVSKADIAKAKKASLKMMGGGLGKNFNHVSKDFGLIFCDKCPNYAGKVNNINDDTTLDELFCKNGVKQVTTYLNKKGVK